MLFRSGYQPERMFGRSAARIPGGAEDEIAEFGEWKSVGGDADLAGTRRKNRMGAGSGIAERSGGILGRRLLAGEDQATGIREGETDWAARIGSRRFRFGGSRDEGATRPEQRTPAGRDFHCQPAKVALLACVGEVWNVEC